MLIRVSVANSNQLNIQMDAEAKKSFSEEILQRALNCWPDAPPEWKELADMLQHGKPLQNYYAQQKHDSSGTFPIAE